MIGRMGKTPKTRRPSKGKAVAYVRVSTDTERQELGAEGQRHAIEQWAKREGVEIITWHTEEVSGGAPLDERPVLLEAVAAVKAQKAGYLVFSTLDRFSREPLAAALVEAELLKAKADLVFADGSGNGNDPTAALVRGIRLAVARFERQMIAARIKAALAVKQRRGEMTGAPRFGYRAAPGPVRAGRDGKPRVIQIVEKDPAEQIIIATVLDLAASMSIRQIEAELAARGVMGRANKPLSRNSIWYIIRRNGERDAA
jgi:DNA invertase Pin-like site-specific DNA recombinase